VPSSLDYEELARKKPRVSPPVTIGFRQHADAAAMIAQYDWLAKQQARQWKLPCPYMRLQKFAAK
jgi:hypothetical protein